MTLPADEDSDKYSDDNEPANKSLDKKSEPRKSQEKAASDEEDKGTFYLPIDSMYNPIL